MTDPFGLEPRQPWSHGDEKAPPDRAFYREVFRAIVEEIERAALAREERMKIFLTWLSVRWALIWLAIGVVIGLGWVIIESQSR